MEHHHPQTLRPTPRSRPAATPRGALGPSPPPAPAVPATTRLAPPPPPPPPPP
eukprot:CAMPEP_0173460714 /NCGR_PEP_ID=MMETSP1357-20121228/63623_1 /TAXON_ID=77926 /ORGANISM="Hemiselmis rufescens, Strain PCC563" /LENGTH=52 /DNA_ID=CAMNT_0014428291 /DNA_START=236 /DNA_END=391 /DNA_ORIENTATION=-